MHKEKRGYGKDFEEIANMFYEFDIDKATDQRAKKENIALVERNSELNKEIKKLKKELERVKLNPSAKKHSFQSIKEGIGVKYNFLSKNSIDALSSAEYLYLNEKEELDYTAVYTLYVKVIEIEIRNHLRHREKSTFGSLIEMLKRMSEFKTFTAALEKEEIIVIRNRGVHIQNITKNQCGKLRKLLLDEGWLNNLIYILENKKGTGIEKSINKEINIISYDGQVNYQNRLYHSYETQDGEYVLSSKFITERKKMISGRYIECDNIEYLMV